MNSQTTAGTLNIDESAWVNAVGGGTQGALAAGSPYPAQVRYRPTRVKQSLTMAACKSALRFVSGANGDAPSNNKKFHMDLTPEEAAALVKIFHAACSEPQGVPPGVNETSAAPTSNRSEPVGSDTEVWETVSSKKQPKGGAKQPSGRGTPTAGAGLNGTRSGGRRGGDRDVTGLAASRPARTAAGEPPTAPAGTNRSLDQSESAPRAPSGWAAIVTGQVNSTVLQPATAAAAAKAAAAAEVAAKAAEVAAKAAAAAVADADVAAAAVRTNKRTCTEDNEGNASTGKAGAGGAAGGGALGQSGQTVGGRGQGSKKLEATSNRAASAASAGADDSKETLGAGVMRSSAPAKQAEVSTEIPAPAKAVDPAGRSFGAWASVVSGKIPDPAKEGWETLVGGKLGAQTPQMEAAAQRSSRAAAAASAKPTGAVAPGAKAGWAATASPPTSPSPQTSATADDVAPLRKAWSGWAVKAPPPKVDLKAEMEAAAAAAAAPAVPSPPSLSSSSTHAENGVGAGALPQPIHPKGGGKIGMRGDRGADKGTKLQPPPPLATRGSGGVPPPPASPSPPQGLGAPLPFTGLAPPPLPASPPLINPAAGIIHPHPTRPFPCAPTPPCAPATEGVGARIPSPLCSEQRVDIAKRLGAEMLETAHVQPFSAKGSVLRKERRAVDLLVHAVNSIVKVLFPQASVEVFGSFPTASWVPGASNLDMALCLPDAALASPQTKMDALNSLAVALRSNPWVGDVNVVPSAHRPLIFMSTHSGFFQPMTPPAPPAGPRPPPGAPPVGAPGTVPGGTANGGEPPAPAPVANGTAPPPLPPGPPPAGLSPGLGMGQHGAVGLPLEVHISIKDRNHKGSPTVRFLQQAELEYPALTPMLVVQKAFLAGRGLRGVYKGGIGSYALALLTLHSLQRKAHEDARHGGGESDAMLETAKQPSGMEDGGNSSRLRTVSSKMDDEADAIMLGESLIHFLEFYGHAVDLTQASVKVHPLQSRMKKSASKGAVAEANGGSTIEWGMFPMPGGSVGVNGVGHAMALGGSSLQVSDPMQAGHNAGGGCFGIAGVQASFREQLSKLASLPADAPLLQHILSDQGAGKVSVV